MHECHRIRNIKENHKTCTNSVHGYRVHCTNENTWKLWWEQKRAGKIDRENEMKGVKKTLNKWTDPQSFSSSVRPLSSLPSVCWNRWHIFSLNSTVCLPLFAFSIEMWSSFFGGFWLAGWIFFYLYIPSVSLFCLTLVRCSFSQMQTSNVHFVWRKICASFPVDLPLCCHFS